MEIEEKKMKQIIGLSIPFEKSDEDAIPVYSQLAKVIKEQIENSRLAVGEQIPPERKIAALNNLSLATVRKALENLVQRGLLSRIQGKGTYVSSTAIRRKSIRYYPFVKDFHSDMANTDIKLIELKTIKGQQWINRHLKIRNPQDLYELRRVLTHRGKPLVYCVSYFSQNIFKGLKEYKRFYFEEFPLYQFLEEKFDVSTTNHIELYSASLADEDTARLLNIERGHPLLRVEMLSLTHREKPYEYRISYCLTDEKKIRRFI